AVMLLFGPRLPGLVVAASGLLGGLLSLVGEYCQRLYQLGQGVPFYELRDRDAERARAEAAEREAAQRAAGRWPSRPATSTPPGDERTSRSTSASTCSARVDLAACSATRGSATGPACGATSRTGRRVGTHPFPRSGSRRTPSSTARIRSRCPRCSV